MEDNKITVLKSIGTVDGDKHEIYLNGNLQNTVTTLPYEISGLSPNTKYEIKIITRDSTENTIKHITIEKIKTTVGNINQVATPDLSGFNSACTYYVYYDGETEYIGNTIDKAAPENWYNYKEKRWANIVTMNNDHITYFTWIPRYEYKTRGLLQETQIRFITKEQTVPSAGYKISDAFTFNDIPLAGYWASKYEVSNKNIEFLYNIDENKITIEKASGLETGDIHEVYVNKTLRETISSLPYEITGLNPNTEYEIKIITRDTTGNRLKHITINRLKTAEKNVNELVTPDLSGFNSACTYYVYYDGDNEVIGNTINNPAPENWYNYKEKKWANIVTINKEQTAYFTWIPRYEYKTISLLQETQIRFITKEQTVPSAGYKISGAFTFNNIPLAGYWASKYEVSQ